METRESGGDRCSKMVYVDPAVVKSMEERIHCRKRDHIMDRLGISLNTWDKLRGGEPVRASLASRLLQKFG